MIDIRDISGDIRLSVQINSGAKGVCTLGGDDYVTLPLVTDTPIPFAVGDYIDLRDTFGAEMGGRLAKVYRLLSVPKPNASPGRYEYELRFDAYYKEWNNKIFKYSPEIHGQEASWSLTAPLDMHLGIFLRNLKAHGFRYDGVDFDFTIDSTVSTKAVAMTYDNMHLLDALYALCAEDKLDCDCWIEDNHIRFGRCEHGTAVTLELGAEVAEMSRSESSGTYANRIYAFGGDRNIPADYRPTTEQTVVNGVVQHRLMLPEGTPYVDARPGLTEAETVEVVKVFDDIYPRRTGTMSDVHTRTGTETNDDGTQTTYTCYRYKDTGLVFKDEYILPGKELQIVFTSGKLNGMTFGVIFNPSPKDASRGEQLWEIVANEDYGRLLPDDTLKPEDGNTYILSGFDIQLVSDRYIPDAEQELLEAAQEYVRKSGVDDGSYQAALYSDWVYADRIGRTFDIGQKVLLKNPAYFGEEGRESRITGWEFNLDLPYDSPRYTIGESVQYSRLGSIEDSLEALTYKGQTYTGGGGSGVYVIRTNDTTPASDSNVFSALRSLRQFTRKDIDDTVAGLLSFAKGLQSTGYTSGTLGTGFGLFKDVDGMSYLELDRLYVRYKAIFDTLEVKHISHVGGEFVVSPAGMECIRVEKVSGIPSAFSALADSQGRALYDKDGKRLNAVAQRSDAYRCYFRSTDGDRTIENQFAVGDQAMCREFNLTGGSVNRYYWRKVIGIGADYIDLSATDCLSGSGIPQAGDSIVTVGNDRDATRRHAIVISSYGGNAPSIMLYTGIDSYSLEGKAIFEVTPDGVNIKVGSFNGTFTGKFNIEVGSTGLENMDGYGDLTDAICEAQDTADDAKKAANAASADAENVYEYAYSQITALNNQISLKVSISDYATDMTAIRTDISEIKQTATSISLTVQSLGRNLFLNSGLKLGTEHWRLFNNSSGNSLTADRSTGELTMKSTGNNVLYNDYIDVAAGEQFTLSGEAYAATAVSLNYNYLIYESGGNAQIGSSVQLTAGQWKKFSITFKAPRAGKASAGAGFMANTTVKFRRLKWERGAIATDWNEADGDAPEQLAVTGIYVEEGIIRLRADNTYFTNSSGGQVAVFTADGKLSVDLIDVDELVARRVKTAESGRRVVIEGNELSMFNDGGELRMKVTGGNLSNTANPGSVELSSPTISLDTPTEGLQGKTVTLATFSLASANNEVTIPEIGVTVTLRKINDGNTLTGHVSLLLDGRNIANWRSETQSGKSESFTMQSYKTSLSAGSHTLSLSFRTSGNATQEIAQAGAGASDPISWVYSDYVTEVASDGFRAASGAGKFLKQSGDGTDIRAGAFRIAVTEGGLQLFAGANTSIYLTENGIQYKVNGVWKDLT